MKWEELQVSWNSEITLITRNIIQKISGEYEVLCLGSQLIARNDWFSSGLLEKGLPRDG